MLTKSWKLLSSSPWHKQHRQWIPIRWNTRAHAGTIVTRHIIQSNAKCMRTAYSTANGRRDNLPEKSPDHSAWQKSVTNVQIGHQIWATSMPLVFQKRLSLEIGTFLYKLCKLNKIVTQKYLHAWKTLRERTVGKSWLCNGPVKPCHGIMVRTPSCLWGGIDVGKKSNN